MSINVSSSGIESGIGEFKNGMGKLDDFFDELKQKATEMKGYWEGEHADAISADLANLVSFIDDIDKKNAGYVAFLNKVSETYTVKDNNLSSSVDNSDLMV